MFYARLSETPIYRIYLWLAIPAFAALIYVLPPFQSPDEPAHFFRALQLSYGDIKPVLLQNADRPAAGGLISGLAGQFVKHYCPEIIWRCTVQDRPPIAAIFGSPRADALNDRTLTAFSNTVIYLPVAHVVPAIGIAIARGIHLSVEGWLYAGRMANAIFAIGITWLSLYLSRGQRCERALFSIALLPMTLSITPTLNADAGVISCSLLMAALCVRILDRSHVSWHWPALGLAMLFVAAKIAYLPLVCVPIACALAGGGLNRSCLLASLIGIFVVLVTAVWSMQVHDFVFPIAESPDVSVAGQMRFILSHPVLAMSILGRAMVEMAPYAGVQLLGLKVSGNGLRIPTVILFVAAAMLMIGLLSGRKQSADIGMKVIIGSALLSSIFATFLFLYLQNTTVASTQVWGYQGRYLLPLSAFLIFVLPTISSEGGSLDARLCAVVVSAGAIVTAATVAFLSVHTWV